MRFNLKTRLLKFAEWDAPLNETDQEVSGMWELTNPSPHKEGLVDIVAVHGLKGDPFESWTALNGPELWLRDFLPKQVPARVLSFGYNSLVEWSKSVADIDDHALDLLNRLGLDRQTQQEKARPIVFIGHSLGGIIIKKVGISLLVSKMTNNKLSKALILAHERPRFHGNISEHVRGVVFLGVPHRGSHLARWGSLFANFLSYASLKMSTNTAVVVDLKHNSETLRDISSQFIEHCKDPIILSFYEGLPMRGFRDPIVDKHSAILGIPNETRIKVNANHGTICKFESTHCPTYKVVGVSIIEMINTIIKAKR